MPKSTPRGAVVPSPKAVEQSPHKTPSYLEQSLKPPVLYHYTTAEGLLGIIGGIDQALWASAVGFSNDTSEAQYATEIASEVVGDYLASGKMRDEWKQVLDFIPYFLSPVDREITYIVSFCERDNVLGQWRAYGGTASFSIGFRGLSALDLRSSIGAFVDIVKVEYDRAKQKSALARRLNTINAALNGLGRLGEGLKDMPIRERITMAQGFAYMTAETWAYSVKHRAFREEEEWRLAVSPIGRDPSVTAGKSLPRRDPELREHRGRLLPYVIVQTMTGKFDVESITVGPSKTQASDAKAVELLAKRVGLSSLNIVLSDVPLQP